MVGIHSFSQNAIPRGYGADSHHSPFSGRIETIKGCAWHVQRVVFHLWTIRALAQTLLQHSLEEIHIG
jgi:hypothetical protein